MENNKIKCSHCGEEISEEDKFCPYCGFKNEHVVKDNYAFLLASVCILAFCQIILLIMNVTDRYYSFSLFLIFFQFVCIPLGICDIVFSKNKVRALLSFFITLSLALLTTFGLFTSLI